MKEDMSNHPINPMTSTSRDLKRLKQNSAASAEELRELLNQMRGRSPTEMLGLVAQSSLFRSFVLSTFVFAGILIAFTVLPYGWAKYGSLFANAGEEPAMVEEKKQEPEPAEVKEPEAAKPVQPEKPADDPDDLLDRLGVGEQKTAPANVNPLESKHEDLFDGLE